MLVRCAGVLSLVVGVASGQSDPSFVGQVFDSGVRPLGSLFEAPGQVTADVIGNGQETNSPFEITPIEPGDVTGTTLADGEQLNLYPQGVISGEFYIGSVIATDTPEPPRGAELNLFGGTTDRVNLNPYATANIYRGTIEGQLRIRPFSTARIFGGVFNGPVVMLDDTTVDIFGTRFLLDGVEITGLTPNAANVLADRDQTLTVEFINGATADFDLNTTNVGEIIGGATVPGVRNGTTLRLTPLVLTGDEADLASPSTGAQGFGAGAIQFLDGGLCDAGTDFSFGNGSRQGSGIEIETLQASPIRGIRIRARADNDGNRSIDYIRVRADTDEDGVFETFVLWYNIAGDTYSGEPQNDASAPMLDITLPFPEIATRRFEIAFTNDDRNGARIEEIDLLGPTIPPAPDDGDFNNDGLINFLDLVDILVEIEAQG